MFVNWPPTYTVSAETSIVSTAESEFGFHGVAWPVVVSTAAM
jgi:hypothetical protein